MSSGPPPASFDDHVKWLSSRLTQDQAGWLFIGVHDGHAVGTASLDVDTRHIGVTIAPEWRGRGFATPIIRALCEKAADHDLVPVHAFIKTGNPFSVRAFRSAGFSIAETAEGDFVGVWKGRP
jgi:RimJ/RimL family protein N-acetyltransferase